MTYIFAVITIAIALIAFSSLRSKPRGISSLPAPSQTVQELIDSGQRTAAVRAYRKQTGASLLEASRIVEHHAACIARLSQGSAPFKKRV